MHILYVTPAYKPAWKMGGPVASVSAAAEGLARMGHEVVVATTNSNLDEDVEVPLGRPVRVDGVTVWYFQREEPLRRWLPFVPYLSQSAGFAYAPGMRRGLKGLVGSADVVDTQIPFVYPTYAASRVALGLGKPLYYHQRGVYLRTHLRRRRLKKSAYLRFFEKGVMRKATLIALSEAERDAFRALAPEAPCHIVPNGVDTPEVDSGATGRIKDRYGVPDDALVVLFLGRLSPWKGADHVLSSFGRIQGSLPDVFLVMAGADECAVQKRWAPISERRGFADKVRFTGVVSGREKADLLDRADLFVLPSAGEGLSMATLEALAHRTAVMLSPECNFREVERVGAGVIVKREIEEMAPVLQGLLASRERLRAMGVAGRRFAMAEYSWSRVCERLVEVYARGCERC